MPSDLASLNRIDWIPVDLLAKVLIEMSDILLRPDKTPSMNGSDGHEAEMGVFHGINPKMVAWETLVPTIHNHLGASVKLVSWTEWLTALRDEQIGATSAAAQGLTGLKLVDFFESLGQRKQPDYSTSKSQAASKTLRELSAVTPEWMQLWLQQWDI